MKLKMDYNELVDRIVTALNSSKSRYVQENIFGICTGLDILGSYIREIGERAIETDDAVILSVLLDLNVIKADTEQEEKEIRERAKKIREGGGQ